MTADFVVTPHVSTARIPQEVAFTYLLYKLSCILDGGLFKENVSIRKRQHR